MSIGVFDDAQSIVPGLQEQIPEAPTIDSMPELEVEVETFSDGTTVMLDKESPDFSLEPEKEHRECQELAEHEEEKRGEDGEEEEEEEDEHGKQGMDGEREEKELEEREEGDGVEEYEIREQIHEQEKEKDQKQEIEDKGKEHEDEDEDEDEEEEAGQYEPNGDEHTGEVEQKRRLDREGIENWEPEKEEVK